MSQNAIKQEIEPYTNISIFQGITQYFDEYGDEWRRIDNDSHYDFYHNKFGSFVFEGSMRKSKTRLKSIKKLQEMFIEKLVG